MSDYSENQWGNRIGAQIRDLGEQTVYFYLPYDDKNLNADAGVVHGGVQASLMHDAGWYLANSMKTQELDSDTALCLLDGQLNYLSAAKEVDLVCEATLLKQTRQMSFVQATVKTENDKTISRGHWVYAQMPKSAIKQPHKSVSLESLISADYGGHKLLDIFNNNIEKRNQGMLIESLGEGKCRIRLKNQFPHQDHQQNLAVGIQYYVADNAAVYAAFSSMERIGRMATTDLKLTLCATAVTEDLLVIGQIVSQTGQAYQCGIHLVGAESGLISAFGTATLWT